MNTTQQDSHGEDELPLDRIARFTDDYIECWQDDNTTDQDLRDLQDDLRNYFEQLATRRAVAELKALEQYAMPMHTQMVMEQSNLRTAVLYHGEKTGTIENRIAELTAELKGHAK